MVRVSIRTPGSTRRRIVDLPAESQVAAVRQDVANELGSPYERLKLIVGGKALQDEKNTRPVTVTSVDGDSLIAVVVPKAPPKHVSSRDGEIEDEDEDLWFCRDMHSGRVVTPKCPKGQNMASPFLKDVLV